MSVVGVVFEGVPFFGDILLRLPKITKDVRKLSQYTLNIIDNIIIDI